LFVVLSNAERQARFQQRLREKLARGVTPEMIDQVARIVWERAQTAQPEIGSWEGVLANVGSRKGRQIWGDHMRWLGWNVPTEEEATAEYGADGLLVRRVMTVLHAASRPPSEREAHE
jgi:hypothetical protein